MFYFMTGNMSRETLGKAPRDSGLNTPACMRLILREATQGLFSDVDDRIGDLMHRSSHPVVANDDLLQR